MRELDITIFDAWILFEKEYHADCRDKDGCSYCIELAKSNKTINLWLPENKSRNSWRVIAIKRKDHNLYLRWTLPKLSAFLGIEYTGWSTGWRLRLGGFGMGKNTPRGLLTIAKNSPWKTYIPFVEYLLWIDIRK